MSPRARKILRYLAMVVVVPLVVGAALVWHGFSSESVAKRLIRLGLNKSGGSVTIGSISGSLRGPLTLRKISYASPLVTARVDSAVLQWSPTGLIRRQVKIDRLLIDGVHIVLPDSTPRDTSTPKEPHLPLDVLLGRVRAEHITVDAPHNVHVLNGTVRLTGRATDYRIAASARIASAALADTTPLTISGRGDLEHLLLDRAVADLYAGTVTADGRVSWYPHISWNLGVVARGIRPARVLARGQRWPGAVSAWLKTAGRIDSVGPVGVAAVDSLGGAIRGRPVSGTLAVHFTGARYEIPSLDVGWGSAHLVASGFVADTIRLRYDATVGNIALLMPQASGSVTLAGTAAGPRATPRVQTRIAARNVAYGTTRVSRVAGRADIGLAPTDPLHVDLHAEGIRLGTNRVDSAVLAVRGTEQRHHLTLAAAAPAARLNLAATGGRTGSRWSGRIGTLSVASGVAGRWALTQRATLTASAGAGVGAATLGQLCLAAERAPDSRICAGGTWRGPAGWRLTSTVDRLPLALVDSLLPDSSLWKGRGLSGDLQAQIDVNTIGHRLAGTLHADVRGAGIDYREPTDTAAERVVFDTAAVDVRAGADGVHGTLALRASHPDSGAIGNLSASVALPRYTRLGLPIKSQPFTAKVDGGIPDLALLRPFTTADSLSGKLTIGLTGDGTLGAPHIAGGASLAAFNIWLPGGRAGRGDVDLTVASTVQSDRTITADLRVAPRGVIYDYTLDLLPQRVVVDSGGLRVQAGPDGLRAGFGLRLTDSTGRRRLASLATRLDLPHYTSLSQTLRLEPMTFNLSLDIPNLGVMRLVTPGIDTLNGSLVVAAAAHGTIAAPQVTGTLRLADLDAHLIQGSTVTGAVDGDLRADVAADSTLSLDLRVAPRDMVLAHTENGVPRRITVDSTMLEVRVGREGLRGDAQLHFDERATQLGRVSGHVTLPQYTRIGTPMDPQPVTASLTGRVDDLSFAKAFSSQVDSLAGRLTLDAGVSGTVASPVVTGGLILENGAAHFPMLGALFHDMRLTAHTNQAGTFTLDGTVSSGPGQLAITGSTPLFPSAARPGRITLKGTDFEVINTDDAHAIVTPDLTVTTTGRLLSVQGSVAIPIAHVQLAEIPVTAVPPSDDVVFVDTLGGTATPSRLIAANVRVTLGDSVTFEGFNFMASLGGQLQVNDQPGRPTTGTGMIVIQEGHYKAYGQNLTISQGLIRFAGGPVDNPGLNIRASRTAEDSVVAGLDIKGTLKSPDVTIFSQPAMSQNRALEYIVLGHPLGENTGGPQGSLMSKAVSSLGLRGGNLLAKTIGTGIGLDEARIETKGDLKQASFVAGRYLTPNLYISYGIGIFDPISTLRLRYVISRHWTIEAQKGQAIGADVLYRVERGPTDSRGALAPTTPATSR